MGGGDPKKKVKSSLEELKRLRQEGVTHFQSVDISEGITADSLIDSHDGDQDACSSDYGDAEDLRDFIEDAGPGRTHGSQLPSKREPPVNRALANFFKKSSASTTKSVKTNEKPSSGGDAYFLSLMQQLDEDEDDDSEDESVNGGAQNDTQSNSEHDDSPEPKTDLPTECALPQSVIPPSEIFAPFDPKVLNDEVMKQLEDEDWNMEAIIEAVNGIEQDSMDSKENQAPDMIVENVGSLVPIDEAPVASSSMQRASTSFTPAADGLFDFYWLDAYEKSSTGIVYLFGKIWEGGSFVSCCVTVQNIQRNLFFLPREYVLDNDGNETEEEVTLAAVQAEIAQIMAKHKIARFESKRATRKYAFEIPEIPAEADWIKVAYGFNSPQLPANLTGKTFSHVFGTNTSALELLLLKRKIMGPSWIRLKPSSTTKQNISWCKKELVISNPKTDMQVLLNGPEAPPLTVMSLSLRTCLNSSQEHEIISASGLIFNSVSPEGNDSQSSTKCNSVFTVVRDPENVGFSAKFTETLMKACNGTKLEVAKNERALLSFLVAMIYRYDPDVLVGHNFLGFDLGVLLHRMKANRVDFWSRLGRLNWSQWPKAKPGSTEASYQERQIVSGRLVCDTWLGAKELVKAKNYSLGNLIEQVLKEKRLGGAELDVFGDPTKITQLAKSPESLMKLLRQAEMDAYQQAMLMFRLMILPLTKQLTNIAGNLWSRTLSGSRAERNEYLLLHEFHGAKFICPDKQFNKQALHHQLHEAVEDDDGEEDGKKGAGQGKRKPAYAGGLVLEPKRGFYDKIVLLLDFNSLYPSIIQEYNICFTTVVRDNSSDDMPEVPDPNESQGVLPRVLKSLVEKRAAVKRLMKDSKTPATQLAQYNIRQQALKLTANSMYGCLGFTHSRFYAKPLAMLITARGRDILQSTVQLAQQQCHLDVVYGDTDSIMIHTGCNNLDQAKKLAVQVKRAVNEKYKLLEIELDGVFEKLLLLRKKKYAALVVEDKLNPVTGKVEISRKLETKGLDMVRRDWCQLSVDACDHVLNKLMNNVAGEEGIVPVIHANLEELAVQVREGKLPLEVFIISKNLTKDPESYADAKSQPHVVVAQRMKARGLSARAGDTIPYVICEGNGNGALSERAYHPDEVKLNPELRVDSSWYLAQQVHPPVSRLCECIEGTDTARLAQCLGLDSRKYTSSASSSSYLQQNEDGETTRLMSFLSDEERFKDVKKLDLACPNCSLTFPLTNLIRMDANGVHLPGSQCPSCSHNAPAATVYCQVLALIRSCLTAYHQGWLKCDEPACSAQTRRMRVYETRCINDGCRGSLRPIIPGSQIYAQLLFLRGLFDFEKARTPAIQADSEALHMLKKLAAEYEPIRAMILHQLNQCSYPIINLREVFAFMTLKSAHN